MSTIGAVDILNQKTITSEVAASVTSKYLQVRFLKVIQAISKIKGSFMSVRVLIQDSPRLP